MKQIVALILMTLALSVGAAEKQPIATASKSQLARYKRLMQKEANAASLAAVALEMHRYYSAGAAILIEEEAYEQAYEFERLANDWLYTYLYYEKQKAKLDAQLIKLG